jgi:CRP/FNR family transcriptional regulator
MALHFSLEHTLRDVPFLQPAIPDGMTRLIDAAQLKRFSGGEILFLEGEATLGLWVMESGRVKVYKLHPEGREHILHFFGPSDWFNEVSALDGGPNPASAAALNEVAVWLVPSETIEALLIDDPSLMRTVIGFLANHNRVLVGQIERVALYTVTERLARFLLEAENQTLMNETGITRMQVAAHINTTPETLSRVLKHMETLGAIRCDRQEVTILNPAILEALAQF